MARVGGGGDLWLPLPDEIKPAIDAAYEARKERMHADAMARKERAGAARRAEEDERERREFVPVRPGAGRVPQ